MTNKEKIIEFCERAIKEDEDVYNLLDLWNEELTNGVEIYENHSVRHLANRFYDYNDYLYSLNHNYNAKDKFIFFEGGDEFWSGNDILNYIDLERVADYCIEHHDNLGAEELDEWVK